MVPRPPGREQVLCSRKGEAGLWWGVVGGERTEPGQAVLTGLGGELGFWFVCDQKPLEDFLAGA